MAEQPKKKAQSGGMVIKKPLSERFAETFFNGSVKEAKSKAVHEIIVPAIKNMIFDAFTGALSSLLNGNGGDNWRRPQSNSWAPGVTLYSPAVPQTNYSTGTKLSQAIYTSSSSRRPAFVAFDYKDDAEKVLNDLKGQLTMYPSVTMATYYDTASEYAKGADTLITITDSQYGWTDLTMARIRSQVCNDGKSRWVIQFPPTQAI